MKFRIEYTDGQIQELQGKYQIHDTYIRCEVPTSRGEDYPWYEMIVPLSNIFYFEGHR